ncbi:MAG: Methyltransferase type 12 [Nitrobacter vulgaris]|jgi:SAM-dependent methyltransferase|nr:Methyltransferase type 12 [Nitrobacter vulgaris]
MTTAGLIRPGAGRPLAPTINIMGGDDPRAIAGQVRSEIERYTCVLSRIGGVAMLCESLDREVVVQSEGRQAHWENVYTKKGENEVSWFQESPAQSLELIAELGVNPDTAIIDIGGGASRLVDNLIAKHFRAVTVLDLSEAALNTAQARLGRDAASVRWLVADITTWEPTQEYDVWHDRAAFHFFTEEKDRAAYVARLRSALKVGGHAIIATFAMDGPEKCSGLPVVRYDADSLGQALGPEFRLVHTLRHEHATPWGSQQAFQFSVFRRCL